ncbi:MAG: thiamine-binding protein [Bacillota bacterium]|nr:MAG: thiamine-binding protein [Bacillota bacterium]
MAIAAVSVAPLGTGEPGVSRFVAEAIKVLDKYPDLEYRIEPMFTTIQGDLRRIFEAVAAMHEAVATMGAVRISTVIKIDDRRDENVPMAEKVRAVERLLEANA